MKYSFAELGSNILTRKFGGTTTGVAEPYLSGYFFVWFERLPADLAYYASQGSSGVGSLQEIQNIFLFLLFINQKRRYEKDFNFDFDFRDLYEFKPGAGPQGFKDPIDWGARAKIYCRIHSGDNKFPR